MNTLMSSYNEKPPVQASADYWMNSPSHNMTINPDIKPPFLELDEAECQKQFFAQSPQFQFNQSPYMLDNTQPAYLPPQNTQPGFDILGGQNFPEGSISDHSSPSNNLLFHHSPESSTSIGVEAEVVKKAPKTKAATKTKKQLLDEQDAILIAKDDSELNYDELQLKRKAQNRAAQRAFRERKESKMKELEAKLMESDKERQKLMEKLEIITKQNMYILTENELLRSKGPAEEPMEDYKFTFPHSQNEFIHELAGKHKFEPQHIRKVYDSPEHPGNKILALGAVWDYLQVKADEYSIDYDGIDIPLIMSKLKGNERCHGFGPAYPLELVDRVIAECCNLPSAYT
ncbi:uncharacterized protein CANTADRAFT_24503 [Suhomyces tanzawaensis NRRL Y-17324]|uniref:BZIP domain-containing protein n=1 Tax=Suhomyces tanzawaensis NRRL Y-17324 TaxID=984487 RepID=A0A1E4SQ65_9ASCO|nr:uncharacterized protein CANTADRAFT_24503 [Suhomyces tanzawaensis NRRL Y-17324]ODV81635.1 hypothetical protein CANTADRAFT_24503 [Suhomyces tanzawaensis NRRL Y-17324]